MVVNHFQGRFLYGAIVSIAILLVTGGLGFLPLRFRQPAVLLMLFGMVLFAAAAIFILAWPFF